MPTSHRRNPCPLSTHLNIKIDGSSIVNYSLPFLNSRNAKLILLSKSFHLRQNFSEDISKVDFLFYIESKDRSLRVPVWGIVECMSRVFEREGTHRENLCVDSFKQKLTLQYLSKNCDTRNLNFFELIFLN